MSLYKTLGAKLDAGTKSVTSIVRKITFPWSNTLTKLQFDWLNTTLVMLELDHTVNQALLMVLLMIVVSIS